MRLRTTLAALAAAVLTVTAVPAAHADPTITISGGGCVSQSISFGDLTLCTGKDTTTNMVWPTVRWQRSTAGAANCTTLQLRIVRVDQGGTDGYLPNSYTCVSASRQGDSVHVTYEFPGDYHAELRTVDVNGHASAWIPAPEVHAE